VTATWTPETRVTVHAHVRVARPPAKTFAYLTDFESWHWWGGGLVSMTRMTPGALRKGTELEQVTRRRGRERTTRLEIVELVKDRVLAIAGKDLAATFRLEPLEGATRVTCEVSVPASGISALFYRVVLRRFLAADLRKFKRSVEAAKTG
jgi:uncharacterized protein YndB with AHSA1/START domain